MKIAVVAHENSWNEITSLSKNVQWERVPDMKVALEQKDAQAIFNLANDASTADYSTSKLPVFINAVAKTLGDLAAPANVIRLNGWNGFLRRPSWELAGEVADAHLFVLDALQRKVVITADQPGFISARIICMIINEAFFAKEQNISTENEIDTAMKLGTNYPKGPFEWATEIGIKNVYELLATLSKGDHRYRPCTMLQSIVSQQ